MSAILSSSYIFLIILINIFDDFFMFLAYVTFFQVFFFLLLYFGLCLTLETFIKCLMILGSIFEWGIKKDDLRICFYVLLIDLLHFGIFWVLENLKPENKNIFLRAVQCFQGSNFSFLVCGRCWFPTFCIWRDREC